MLFVLPFLVMAIAFLSGYFSLESLQSVQVKGVINMAYINQLDKSWLSAIGFVMVLGVAYLIFFLSERFKLLGQTTTLPSLIYILLTSGIMVNVGFDYLLIAVFIVTVAVWKLQMAINDTKSNGALYDFRFSNRPVRCYLSEVYPVDRLGFRGLVLFGPFYLEGYCGFVVGNSDAGSVYCFLLFLDRSFGIVAGYFYG